MVTVEQWILRTFGISDLMVFLEPVVEPPGPEFGGHEGSVGLKSQQLVELLVRVGLEVGRHQHCKEILIIRGRGGEGEGRRGRRLPPGMAPRAPVARGLSEVK